MKKPAPKSEIKPHPKKVARSIAPEHPPKVAATTGLGLSKVPAVATAERGAEIVAALLRFGFGEFVRKTRLSRHHKSHGKPGGDNLHGEDAIPVRVRLLLQSLGPTFVKIGQIMSTRPDLIPQEWVEELKKLQSNVPPAPWSGKLGVLTVLRKELGPKLKTEFKRIDEVAMAAASMAQVHRAELTSGEHVVLKILRPGIREQMAADLELLRHFAALVQPHLENLGFDAVAVVGEFAMELEHETDLSVEAESTRRMGADFNESENIRFPRVYEKASTRSVLVLEEVRGALLAKMNLSRLTRDEREQIIRNGADMVFRQCLEIGFFHADPHPGNIYILNRQKLCFIDCGMTGLIDPPTMEHLAIVVHGTVNKELDNVVRVAVELSGADARMIDNRAFRADVWKFIDHFSGVSLNSIRLGLVLSEFFSLLRKYHLRCPADIVYLIKAVTTIEGVAEELSPEFDLVGYVRPFLEKAIARRYGIEALGIQVEHQKPGSIESCGIMVVQKILEFEAKKRGLDFKPSLADISHLEGSKSAATDKIKALRMIQQQGVANEKDFPKSRIGTPTPTALPRLWGQIVVRPIDKWSVTDLITIQQFDWEPLFAVRNELIKEEIRQGRMVIVATKAAKGTEGNIDKHKGEMVSHAMIIAGFETINGRTTFEILNSWGTHWGNNGWGTMGHSHRPASLFSVEWRVAPENPTSEGAAIN